jgi:ketosteroid isomerase-like protein
MIEPGVCVSAIFNSALDAEQAFYSAFARGDFGAMREVWSADAQVSCIHPVGGRILKGYEDVMAGWQAIFSGNQHLDFQIDTAMRHDLGELAVHTGIEHIRAAGEQRVRARVAYTNAFRRTEQGWKMVLHHTSMLAPAEADKPDGDAEAGHTLH